MLVEFSVGNYRSFKDTVSLSLLATKAVAPMGSKLVDEENTFEAPTNIKLLRSAAIYGANASGKSNLTKALVFMRRFVIDSAKESQSDEPIKAEPFRLTDEMDTQPSFFQVVFFLKGMEYRYGFEVTKDRVVSEWLFYTPNSREAKLFVREYDEIQVSSGFKEGKPFVGNTRENALFLSVIAQLNGPLSRNILSWFRGLNTISGLSDRGYRAFTENAFTNDLYRDEMMNFIKSLDIDIRELNVNRINMEQELFPDGLSEDLRKALSGLPLERSVVKTMHQKYCDNGPIIEEFDMDKDESEGTKKLFSLAGPVVDTLKKGKILIIDELDARLHPLVTRAIIKMFHGEQTNPNCAQLIFTTHDTNLLDRDLLRRDQIWFTEKDTYGSTHLHSLVEYKIRNDRPFEKEYFEGKYGAIPFIGNIEQLFGNSDAE